MLGWPTDASFADRHAGASRQRNIHQRHLREFLENLARLISQSRCTEGLRQRLS